MTAVRPAREQWDAEMRGGVPTLRRANACSPRFGKSGRSFRLTHDVCAGVRVREGAPTSKGAPRAYGSGNNYSHSSQEAESLAGCGLRREGSAEFSIPLFPWRRA